MLAVVVQAFNPSTWGSRGWWISEIGARADQLGLQGDPVSKQFFSKTVLHLEVAINVF